MEYLGLFCLGVFAGAIATLGLRFIKDVDQWQKALAVVLPAVLSGLAMVVVDRFKYSPALGSYPLGLVAALMWAYIDTAVMNVTALRGTTMSDQAATQELKAEYDTLAWKAPNWVRPFGRSDSNNRGGGDSHCDTCMATD